jgi:hypothetical protein
VLFFEMCRTIHFALFGLMRESMGLFTLLPILLFAGPVAPFTRTILSNSVPTSQQAKIFAAFSAVEGFASLFGPVYSAAYTLLVQAGSPWVIFEIMSAASFASLLIILYVRGSAGLRANLPPDDKMLREELEEEGEGEEEEGGMLDGYNNNSSSNGAELRGQKRGLLQGSSEMPLDPAPTLAPALKYRHLSRDGNPGTGSRANSRSNSRSNSVTQNRQQSVDNKLTTRLLDDASTIANRHAGGWDAHVYE